MKIVYIHGANATPESFNYLRTFVTGYDEIVLEYDCSQPYSSNLEDLAKQLKNQKDLFFIGHSMGGLFSLQLANQYTSNTLGGVTLSTPYGGAEIADYAKYFLPFSQLLRDVGPRSATMRLIKDLKVLHPWTNIVTTRGSCPWILEPSDGVVTVKSMSYREDIEVIKLHKNHYEVLISPDTVEIVKQKLNL